MQIMPMDKRITELQIWLQSLFNITQHSAAHAGW